MNFTKREIKIISLFVIVLICFAVFSAYVFEGSFNVRPKNDMITITGRLAIWNNGKLVYNQSDIIFVISYDFIICAIFGDSTACSTAGGSSIVGQPNHVLTGVGLSTDGTTPQASTALCPSELSGNGLSPVIATTSHSANTNNVILTATFTVGGSPQNGVQKACLDRVDSGTVQFAANFAADLFTPQNLGSGGTFILSWTFSF